MADPRDPDIERLSRQKYINIFDLQRFKRKNINDRLSFKNVLNLGNLSSQTKSIFNPTAAPPTTPVPTPTPTTSPTPTPTPTPTFFKPNTICIESGDVFLPAFSAFQTFYLIAENYYQSEVAPNWLLIFDNGYWYLNNYGSITFAYAPGSILTLPLNNEWKTFPSSSPINVTIYSGSCNFLITPTPSPTPTQSSTPTPTPTPSLTRTPTPTPTNTPTPSPTPSPTVSPTSTPTRTPTPTPSTSPTSTPVPPTPTPTNTPVSLNFLSSLPVTEFSFYAVASGGSTAFNAPYLSGTITAPSSAFNQLTNIKLSLPNANNSYSFGTAENSLDYINYLSLTGSRFFGESNIALDSVKGGTEYAGINSISGLKLNLSYFLPHLPFAVVNEGVYTQNYRNTYLAASSGNYKNFEIKIKVPYFSINNNDFTYNLKVFYFSRNSYQIPESYNIFGQLRSTNIPDTFVQIIPKDPALSGIDISTHPVLSSILLSPGERESITPFNSYYSVFDGISSSETAKWLFILSSVSLSTFWGYQSRPIFYTNPVKFNNNWGYLMNSTEQVDILSALEYQNYTFSPITTDFSDPLFCTVAYAGSSFYALLSNFYFLPTGLTISDLYPLTSFSYLIDGLDKYIVINVPVDDNYERTIVSFYAS